MDSDLYSRAVVAAIHSIRKFRNWLNRLPDSTSTPARETKRRCKCCADYNYTMPGSAARFLSEEDNKSPSNSIYSLQETDRPIDREHEDSRGHRPRLQGRTLARKSSQINDDQTVIIQNVDERRSLFLDKYSTDIEPRFLDNTDAFMTKDRSKCMPSTTHYESYAANIKTNKASESRKVSIISIASIKLSRAINDHENSICSRRSSSCIEGVRTSIDESGKQHILSFKNNFICLWSTEAHSEIKQSKPPPEKFRSRGEITGHMKLCAQYFGNSKVLRVIVRRSSHLRSKRGHVLGKLQSSFLYSTEKGQKFELRKVKAASDVVFNQDFYFDDIDEEKIDQLVLKMRLYNKERLLGSKKLLGEMIIPVFKYDLSMDTNIKGHLRQRKAEFKKLEDYDDDSDIEVNSEDRSIAASVAASLKSSPQPRLPQTKVQMHCLPNRKKGATNMTSNTLTFVTKATIVDSCFEEGTS